MQELKITNQFCDRRSFLLASSAFVAGTLVSCGKIIEPPSKTTSTTYAPVDMRVRIGKQTKSVDIANLR